MASAKGRLVWGLIATLMVGPIILAALSPYLAYRNPAYIVGGFSGIVGLALFVIQPLLSAGYPSDVAPSRRRRWHQWTGTAIVACVVMHVGGLYVTSPQDTLDALLLVSPTPFSLYGVAAMWTTILIVGLIVFRRRLGVRTPLWQLIHSGLALLIVVSTVIHALQIEGTMETYSKWALSVTALLITAAVTVKHWIASPRLRGRTKRQHPNTE